MKLPRSASIFQRQNAGTGAGFIQNNQRPFLKLRLKLAKRIDHQLANRGRRHILEQVRRVAVELLGIAPRGWEPEGHRLVGGALPLRSLSPS